MKKEEIKKAIETSYKYTSEGLLIDQDILINKILDLSQPEPINDGLRNELTDKFIFDYAERTYFHHNNSMIEGVVEGCKLMRDKLLPHLRTSNTQSEWISENMPLDGTNIIRWHKYNKSPCIVSYRPGLSKEIQCVWLNSTKENTWPEESFAPNIWMKAPIYE